MTHIKDGLIFGLVLVALAMIITLFVNIPITINAIIINLITPIIIISVLRLKSFIAYAMIGALLTILYFLSDVIFGILSFEAVAGLFIAIPINVLIMIVIGVILKRFRIIRS